MVQGRRALQPVIRHRPLKPRQARFKAARLRIGSVPHALHCGVKPMHDLEHRPTLTLEAGPAARASNSLAKPRLLFFRAMQKRLPDFVRIHLAEQARCLSHHFDLVQVFGSADYDALCDRHQPDLALFESGVYTEGVRRRISRTETHPQVPKLGFLHSDAYAVSRTLFLYDMDRWGVETFVAMSVVAGRFTPEISDQLFYWPNFIDPSVFYPGVATRTIPVLLTGSRAPHYPWRNAVFPTLKAHFRTVELPHHGHFNAAASARMTFGNRYAEALSMALVVPTCGTFAQDLVRKHLEIPASGACLVTERSEALEAAGFIDGVNCIFSEPGNAATRVGELLDSPEDLERISRAGHQLILERHTLQHRREILDWFELNTKKTADQVIRQPAPFSRLRLQSRSSTGTANLGTVARHDWLRERSPRELVDARTLESRGDFRSALAAYRTVLAYHYMPEAALGAARCLLTTGDALSAHEHVWDLLKKSVKAGVKEPDPVEWATYLRILLCRGQLVTASERSTDFPGLIHVELARIRSSINFLAGCPHGVAGLVERRPGRRSVHEVRPESDEVWMNSLLRDLLACGQVELARRLVPLFDSFGDKHVPSEEAPLANRTSTQRSLARRRQRLPGYLRDPVGTRLVSWLRTTPAADRARRVLYEAGLRRLPRG